MTSPRETARPDHVRNIVRLFEAIHGHHDMHSLFSDCMEALAVSIANAVDLFQREEREARYMAIVKRHGKETMEAFARIMAEVVFALEDEPGDVLGRAFGELGLGNDRTGQFFTPYHLCRTMAGITMGNAEETRRMVEEKGYITVQEPAVGAGAMIIALAEEFRSLGFEPATQMHVTAIDVDPRAVHMAYIQLSLLSIPAVVILGNTLSLEVRSRWFTPAHILGGWSRRLARQTETITPVRPKELEEPRARREPEGEEIRPLVVSSQPQLALFGEVAP